MYMIHILFSCWMYRCVCNSIGATITCNNIAYSILNSIYNSQVC